MENSYLTHSEEKCELSYHGNLLELGTKGAIGVVNGVGWVEVGITNVYWIYLFAR